MRTTSPLSVLALVASILVPSILLADTVRLKGGRVLEGKVTVVEGRVVVTPAGGEAVTVDLGDIESIEIGGAVEEEPVGEDVDDEGDASAEKRIRKLIRRTGSTAPGVAEEARARLEAYEDGDKLPVLLKTLGDPRKPVRIYSGTELGRIGGEEAVEPLVKAAMEDRYRSVRVTAVSALQQIGAEDTALHFVAGLGSSNPYQRLHAIEGLKAFPHRQGVRGLIESWHGISGGFGQGYFMDVVVQAYITDYDLASGGTGFVAVEIADPQIGALHTGTVLDVKIEYVEIVARIQTLSYLTGVNHGTDRKAWVSWYNENKDTFELAGGPAPEKP